MRILFLIGLFLSFQVLPARAEAPCAEPRTTISKIYDKMLSSFDTVMPAFFQDPQRSIQFHLLRSKKLYLQAKDASYSNAGKAIRLATSGQHHLTLLEQYIRQIQNPKDVPFPSVLSALEETSQLQNEILQKLPASCTPPITQLQSFEIRTETVMKKLYYESLLL
jgi:hypothetical protein